MAHTDRRRIALVIGQLGFGGAESQLYELAKRLHATDDVVVYCLSERTEPYGRLLEAAGVTVRCFPARGRFDLSRVRALRAAVQDDAVQVLHAYLFIASAYAYLATRGSGVVLVTSARNCKPEPNPLRRAVMRRAFAASRAVICNSRVMREYAIDYYRAPRTATHVVYNGVDATRFKRRAEHARWLAGTVGRLERQKNVPLLLRAARAVLAAAPHARFAVVGEGSLREELMAESGRLGVSAAVDFRGPTEDVPGFFAQLGQFWLGSDWEGTPNVVLEAMAAGLPVVATDAGAVRELVADGVTGFVVPCGDADAFAERALRLDSDPALAAELGTAARRHVREMFSIERMVRETRRVYALASEDL